MRVRFDAFPYQKYGQIDAEIIQFDKTLLAETPGQSLGFQPAYRLRAHLIDQALSYRAETFPLRSGMQIEADILIDRRRLVDWILEPLFGFRTRTEG